MSSTRCIDIDGGIMEGGGQILRIALALSVLQKMPIRVHSIRAGRQKPGLRPQHLKGLEIGRDVCGGRLSGAEIGSTTIIFNPGKLNCGVIYADTQTAGSVGLLIQVGLPCALFSNGITVLKLRGGTNAEMAPQIDYTIDVFRPLLRKFGATFNATILKRGYFPRGGGEVTIEVNPVACLTSVDMTEQGDVVEVFGKAFVAGQLPLNVSQRMAEAATHAIKQAYHKAKVQIEAYKESPGAAVGSGSGIILYARTSTGCLLGASALGARDSSDVDVGEKAAKELLEDLKSGACVDRYSQDQMIILMALAKGKSRVLCGEVTMHTKTAIHFAQLLTQVLSRRIPCKASPLHAAGDNTQVPGNPELKSVEIDCVERPLILRILQPPCFLRHLDYISNQATSMEM